MNKHAFSIRDTDLIEPHSHIVGALYTSLLATLAYTLDLSEY